MWPSGRGNFDVTYGSHAVHLALYHGEPCVAVHHGGGWEWMTLRGPPGQFEALSGVQDERARYALAYAIITGGAQAHRDAIADTSAKWARAFREKRIKNRRARGTVRTEIIPAWIGQVDGKDATPRLPSSDAAISMARSVAPEGARVSAVSSL
ncbi:MAG: hypothetical protein KKA05_10400 [Alphaproteobacteria bacterium]|nr:hypothetical protein [Alphaproteobacteria bacterium]